MVFEKMVVLTSVFLCPKGSKIITQNRSDYSIDRSAWRESTYISPKDLMMILSNMLYKTYHASDSKSPNRRGKA